MSDLGGALQIIQRRTVAGEAIDQFSKLITEGRLGPGQKLPPERSLATLLGISRPSVREAVSALTAMGILEIRHGKGTYVSMLNPEILAHPFRLLLHANRGAIQELFEIRLLLEEGATRLAAERIDETQLQELREGVARAAATVDDLPAFLLADVSFHQLIHKASGNSIIAGLMESVSALWRESRGVTGQFPDMRSAALRQHRAIYRSLASHDADGAVQAMHKHLMDVRRSSYEWF
jgi:DNA-binding FadR family transcriptional regulator